ncbi:sulfur carrier protein ThiS [Planctomicrobium sp. SH664]|uniref:sulfur carrier protein ThiS n=1 Tax=Planctomicrobium sp. SH664 TaxID=3448125 RepID=UPI003F5BB624
MQVQLNGAPRELAEGITIAELLKELELDPRFLAVERNRDLVPRQKHAECVIHPGDELEIVTLVGGG